MISPTMYVYIHHAHDTIIERDVTHHTPTVTAACASFCPEQQTINAAKPINCKTNHYVDLLDVSHGQINWLWTKSEEEEKDSDSSPFRSLTLSLSLSLTTMAAVLCGRTLQCACCKPTDDDYVSVRRIASLFQIMYIAYYIHMHGNNYGNIKNWCTRMLLAEKQTMIK